MHKASASPPPIVGDSVQDRVDRFIAHLRRVEDVFNSASREHGLGVEISAQAAIKGIKAGVGVQRAMDYTDGADDSGILHDEQIVTAVAAIAQIVAGNEQVLVHGPMQSGKTTTSLAMQLTAPTYYLIKGRALYPFYLLTAHTSQEEQTLHELQRFVGFYSNLTFHRTAKTVPLAAFNTVFTHTPTLEIYRENVLKDALEHGLFSQQLKPEDFMSTRVMGEKIDRIAARLKKIVNAGFVPLLIIDEPQYGVMDRIVEDPNTKTRRKVESVFKRIFRAVERVLKVPKGSHAFVALSATPYEMYDIEGITVVRQKLGGGYQGFNFFAGEAIDPDAKCSPPTIVSLSEAATRYKESFLGKINMAAFNKSERFVKVRRRLDVPEKMTHAQYRAACVGALGKTLRKIALDHPGESFGVCIRSRNNNDFARVFATELGIDDVYETLHYSGDGVRGMSVKRLLATRKNPRKPYVLWVTNRARMGDAFPKSARYFIELTEKFTDMNSMFQGFIGRACGYGKCSTVILSDANADMIRTVSYVDGRYVFTPSRGSVIVGRKRRGRPSGLVVVERGDDSVLERFFSAIDNGFRHERLTTVTGKSLPLKRKGGGADDLATAPLFRLAAATGLFEHVESPANRDRIAPGYPDFHIVREDEQIVSTGRVTGKIGYKLDGKGGCTVIAREYTSDLRQSGVRGRGEQKTLLPQVVFRKYNPATGKTMTDPEHRREGEWRAHALVLPLLRPVSPIIAADVTLPRPQALFYDNTNAAERCDISEAVRNVGRLGQGRPRR